MDVEQLNGLLRNFTPIIAAAFVAFGMDSTTAGLTAGAVIAVGMAVWSFMSNRQSSIVAKAAKMPGVSVTVDNTAPVGVRKEAAINPNIGNA